MRENIDKFPWLGDLPVLGALFRSQKFQSDQSELVMFVTAHLARPMNTKDIRLPTDAFVDPSDVEFFLLGKLNGKKNDKDTSHKPKLAVTKEQPGEPSTGDDVSVKEEQMPVREAPVERPIDNGEPTFGHDL